MFNYESSWSDAAVRRFLARATPEAVNDLFDLRIADAYGMTRVNPALSGNPWSENLVEFRDRIAAVLAQKDALTLKDLAVNGKDLIQAGIPAGKALGAILGELFETVLDSPAENTKEHLLEVAKKIYEKHRNA
jgi:hypothetical protein